MEGDAFNSSTNGPAETPRLTYTIDEAAKKLGVSRNSAYEAAHAGQIPTLRIGKRLLVPRQAFDAMIRGETQPG